MMEGDDLPAGPWSCPDDDDFPGDEAATAGGDDSSFGGHYSADDLFELVRQGGGVTGRPAVSCLRPSPLPAIPPLECIPLDQPPLEDPMVAWFNPIFSGQDYHDRDGLKTTTTMMMKEASEAIGSSGTMITERKRKLPATDGMSATKDTNTRSDSSEKKALLGGSSSSRKQGSSHNSQTHNIAEKRRRCRIKERLRTLQELVPGCDKDKSSQASTLDQTIQYMKSLQNQLVQAMSMRPPETMAIPAAMPIPMPPAAVDPAGTTTVAPARMVGTMVPFGAMLPYPQYHSVSVMMPAAAAAAAASLFQPAQSVSNDPLGTSRDRRQCSVSMEQQQQQQHRENGRKRF